MAERISLVADQSGHLDGVRPVGPDHRVVAVLVRAENRVRVVVFTGQQPIQVGWIGPQVRARQRIGSSHLERHFPHSLQSRFGRCSGGIRGMFST